jgi:hypothetical protein
MFLHRIGNPILYLSRLGRTILRRKVVSPEFNESFTLNATNTSSVTPEPGSYAALILAFGGVMLVARSRRAKQSA